MLKRTGMLVVMLMALLLVACGSDGEEDEPTATATEPPAATEAPSATSASTPAGIASPAATTPDLSGMATPALIASPMAATPVGVGTPLVREAPGIAPIIERIASPAASPVGGLIATPMATPQASPAATVFLAGRVVLPGSANEAYVLTDAGCVGLGADADLRAGRQVVVRDERGTIIGVTTLEPSSARDACAWTFMLEVPASAFYEVAIPMKAAMVFTHEEITLSDGEIEMRVR